jgi:primary-amine oxidase
MPVWSFMRPALAVIQLALLTQLPGAAHPLAPLTVAEIRAAVKIIRASGRMPAGARYALIALDEPPKASILRNLPVPRRAFAVIYDRAADRTSEAIADLTSGTLASWKDIPGAQPPVGGADSNLADRIVRADPRWELAMRARGIRDPNRVLTVAWPAGYFALPFDDPGRIVRVTPYYAAGENYYAHPVEGVAAHVNITTGKVLNFVDVDRNVPVSRENAELSPEATQPYRTAPALLEIKQSAAPFQVEDGEVRWQKWRFRYALHPREGVVLYTVGYEDGGKVRPILYRASLSEMAVPYGDPGGAWFFRNTFDAGELGLGILAGTLRPGLDCPQNCSVIDAVVAGESGEPRTIRGAVALFERDTRVAWKHGSDARRGRDLVLFYSTEAGNYEYGFEWIFHQDGSLEMRVLLTGIMSVKGVAESAHDSSGHLVAKNLAAVHHQHFFSFRLDFDVDGVANRLIEMNSVPIPAGPRNPYRGAFTMQETTLATERQAQRQLNLESSRRWVVVNPSVLSPLGHPTGFALLPGENALPLILPDSWVRKRAGFLNAHIWATSYSDSERYSAGDYPYQSKTADGLAKWTAADRRIDNRDLVLWYTMGITHNPRPEDWPVMPVHEAGFKLLPWGFFARNPAMDLPPAR